MNKSQTHAKYPKTDKSKCNRNEIETEHKMMVKQTIKVINDLIVESVSLSDEATNYGISDYNNNKKSSGKKFLLVAER